MIFNGFVCDCPGPAANRYEAYGHHGVTIRGREQLLQKVTLEVNFVHDVTMNNCHGCVVSQVSSEFLNMDHHRQVVYDSVWTQLDLGNPNRMWDSTGNPSEGYNSAAYNTYWNLISDDPSQTYWPKNGGIEVYPQWGYHKINIVATGISEKPVTDTGIDNLYPSPYSPENSFLETMPANEVWPSNIYEAQVKAYREGKLTGIPQP